MGSGSSSESAGQPGLDYLDTVTLLQDEIARLEAQLLDRDAAGADPLGAGDPNDDVAAPGEAELRRELARREAELSARDETINLLLDQIQLVEEAESASRAEWEQLAAWVTEVEERVERQAGAATTSSDEDIAASRRLAEECRTRLERERESWARQRSGLEREIERLEGLAARPGSGQGASVAGAETAIARLEAENRRLGHLHQELEGRLGGEIDVLRGSLESARAELANALRERDESRDERQRERLEFEIALAAMRSHATRGALAAGERKECTAGSDAAGDQSPALEADMRIRAFRQHLREIHVRELEDRKPTGLAARLSRLWSRTGPR